MPLQQDPSNPPVGASSGIARDELFITTKLWVQDSGEDNTRRAFEASLTATPSGSAGWATTASTDAGPRARERFGHDHSGSSPRVSHHSSP